MTFRGKIHKATLDSLIADLKINGQLNPVLLERKRQKNRYRIIDGWHRIKALIAIGQLKVLARLHRSDEVIEVGVHQCKT
jgi:ParB-like chromosome segregation protein Spo0J